MSAPRTPGIYIVMMTLVITLTLAWSSIAAPSIEVGFFWASTVSALAVSIFAWRRSDRIGQGGMLLVYVILACSITLAVTSIADITNFTILGDKRDAETGMLLGSLVAFGIVSSIAVRCSKQFPASLAWGAFVGLLMAFSYTKTLPQEYALIVIVAALCAGMAAFIMLCRCKTNLSDNQYLSCLTLISAFIALNCPKNMSNYTAGLSVSTMLFLAGLLFFIERRPASTSSRITGLMFLYLGFSSVVQDVLLRGLGFNEIVANFPSFLFCILVVAWIRFRKSEIQRGQYWIYIFSVAFFGICSLVPESHSDSIPGPMFGTMVLFVVAAVGYAYSATITVALSWRDQFRYAFVTCGFLISLGVTAVWFTFSTDMLVRNYELTRILALLKGTSIWPGDSSFIRLVMRVEGLWPEYVRNANIRGQNAKQSIKAIRPSADRFSRIMKAEYDRLEDLGYETEGMGIRWILLKDCLALLKVNSSSSAGSAGLSRGDRIVAVNGKQVKDFKDRRELGTSLNNWNDGKTVSLGILTKGGLHRTVPISFGVNLQDQPFSRIINLPKRDKIGYLYLDSFDAAHLKQIQEHFMKFKNAGVQDLILDLRYNGGGLADNSVLLANLIAGKSFFGKRFVSTEHSQRHTDQNSEHLFEKLPESLHIKRLVVITTDDTCSASEVVINGLRPYMPVYTVGSTTCGKPYVMQGFRFGEEIIYPITARVVNSLGDGHYETGIRPDFQVNDDLTHNLSYTQEGMLKKALEVLEKETLRM